MRQVPALSFSKDYWDYTIFQGRGGDATPIVTQRRIDQGRKSIVALSDDFKSRLKGVVGSSRMAVVLKLFVVYGIVAVAEVVGLWLHGFWGINLVRILRMVVGA